MSRYVVDANVAVKWFYGERFHINALQYLKSNAQLISPDIIQQEFANVMLKKIQLGDTTQELGWQCYEDLFQSESLLLLPTSSFIKDAFNFSLELNHPIYDCIYLAAAIHTNAPVVTADERFIERVKKHGQYNTSIRWIEESPED